MARKTMSERYAAQRSRKDARRRSSLPRLSDATFTALHDHEIDQSDDTAADEYMGASETAGTPVSATSRQPQRPVMPRRSAGLQRAGGLAAAPTFTQVDYHYVLRDLRRIAITAVTMLVLLIILNIILQAIVH